MSDSAIPSRKRTYTSKEKDKLDVEKDPCVEKKAKKLILEDICSICLSDVIEEPCHTDECKHISCFTCLKQWYSKTLNCPLCRSVPGKTLTVYSKSGAKQILSMEEIKKTLPPRIQYRDEDHGIALNISIEEIIREIERNLDALIEQRSARDQGTSPDNELESVDNIFSQIVGGLF